MSLVKYSNGNVDTVFDSMLNKFFNDDFGLEPFLKTNVFKPVADVIENDNEYIVELMVPGFKKDNFNLELDNGVLSITGERFKDENLKYTSRQSYYGKFTKSFTLPDHVKQDDVKADYVDGVLKVTIPKDGKKLTKKTIKIN